MSARRVYLPVVLSLLLAVPTYSAERSTEDVVQAMADGLEQSQIKSGPVEGSWPYEEYFAAPSTAGLVAAYEWLGKTAYNACAWRAGYYIIVTSDRQGNLLGDEAYAFVRLSDIFSAGAPAGYPRDPALAGTNIWRAALEHWYDCVRDPNYEGSTQAYLRHFDGMEPSTATFYLAHHVIAVYFVGDRDKELWRDALILHLSRVDDESDFPVTALGAATWALAKIDGLRRDVLVASDVNSPQWQGVVLADLPALLLSHQVPEGEPLAGSFYWRLDHTAGDLDGVTAGYVEDTIFGVTGLVAAASRAEDGPGKRELERAIIAGQAALLQGVDPEGQVHEHLSGTGQMFRAYAGELLGALRTVKQYFDQKSPPEVPQSVGVADRSQ